MGTSSFLTDVTLGDFDSLVLSRSHTTPVLVDFWAPWCAPCKMLMPVLARMAEQYQGKFYLAKVNTDVEQELAARYGVRSLPTVKLFRNGVVVDEFLGAQPESVIRELIDRHAPRPSDSLLAAARQSLARGETSQAGAILRQALETDPANDDVRMELARLLFDQGDTENAERVLDGLSPSSREKPEAVVLLARAEIARIAAAGPDASELERIAAIRPADSEAGYRLSAHKVLQGDYESALELLLEIVRHDRHFGDDAARKTMLTIFTLLGGKGDLVKRFRSQLSMALN